MVAFGCSILHVAASGSLVPVQLELVNQNWNRRDCELVVFNHYAEVFDEVFFCGVGEFVAVHMHFLSAEFVFDWVANSGAVN